jgi:hypothetical protein
MAACGGEGGGAVSARARAGVWRTGTSAHSTEAGWRSVKKGCVVRGLVRGHHCVAQPGKEKGKWVQPSKIVPATI